MPLERQYRTSMHDGLGCSFPGVVRMETRPAIERLCLTGFPSIDVRHARLERALTEYIMPSPAPNQFALLNTRRFLPAFLVQFLGAFNDQVYQKAWVALIT